MESQTENQTNHPLLGLAICAVALAPHLDNLDLGTPGRCDQIVNREGYALGYSERHEQPLWVTYRLTAAEVTNAAVRRATRFHADSAIATGSASPQDYAGSGYDRGHLAPAADMRFSPQAMADSFSMANVSPQVPQLNRGPWRVLEDWVRELALRYDSVVVVTGPVFSTNAPPAAIGANGVSVPAGFYKVLCCTNAPAWMCAYLLPNVATNAPPDAFAVPTVEVERLTGLNFFSALPAEAQTNLKTRVHAPLAQVRDNGNAIYVIILTSSRDAARRYSWRTGEIPPASALQIHAAKQSSCEMLEVSYRTVLGRSADALPPVVFPKGISNSPARDTTGGFLLYRIASRVNTTMNMEV